MGCQASGGVATTEDFRTAGASPLLASKSLRQGAVSSDPESTFQVFFEKKPGDKLGVGLGSTMIGAAIFSIKPGGLLDQHNQKCGEEDRLFPGCVMVEVNGKRGYWAIFEELTRLGKFNIVISRKPPEDAGENWFKEIESLGKEMEARGSPFMLRLRPEHPDQPGASYSSLPTVRAGDVGVDQCAICLGDVSPNSKLMKLPCGHCFHLHCAGRWLTDGAPSGKRQCCPLCCQRVTDSQACCDDKAERPQVGDATEIREEEHAAPATQAREDEPAAHTASEEQVVQI